MAGIFLGDVEITKIYHGTTLVNNAYSGEDVLFPNVPPVETDYLQTISAGNRNGIIGLINNGVDGFGDYNRFLNGDYGSNNTFFYNRSNDGWQNLDFDLGSPWLVDGINWFQQFGNQGGVVIEGSNNRTTWTQFGDPFNLGGEHLFPNSATWRYYRIRFVSGSRTSAPYIYQINFKAAPQ